MPIIRPPMIVAALFAFLLAFDEVVLASFLAGPVTETLPVKMRSGIRFDLDTTIAAASTVLMLISGTLAAYGEWVRRRGQALVSTPMRSIGEQSQKSPLFRKKGTLPSLATDRFVFMEATH